MNKNNNIIFKILLMSLLILACSSLFANDLNSYIGLGVSIDNFNFKKNITGKNDANSPFPGDITHYPSQSTDINAISPMVYFGIAKPLGKFNLAAELFFSNHNANEKTQEMLRSDDSTYIFVSEKIYNSIGVSVIPGYYINTFGLKDLLYARLGIVATKMRLSMQDPGGIHYTGDINKRMIGYQGGIGIKVPIHQRKNSSWALKLEYDYTYYPINDDLTSDKESQQAFITAQYNRLTNQQILLGIMYQF